jgi:NAD(P)-dependent dehydrogenase (short-subunit alcohol dehydrogenase family)
VIMACRSVDKAEAAANEIRDATRDVQGSGTVRVVRLDLGSLASVRHCAQELLETEDQIHLLINNAGTARDLRANLAYFLFTSSSKYGSCCAHASQNVSSLRI